MENSKPRKPGELARRWERQAPARAPIVHAAHMGWFSKIKELIPNSAQSDIQEAFELAVQEERPLVFKSLLKHGGEQAIQATDIANAKDLAGSRAREIRIRLRSLDGEQEIQKLRDRLIKVEAIEDYAELVLRRRQAELVYAGKFIPVASQDDALTLDLGHKGTTSENKPPTP